MPCYLRMYCGQLPHLIDRTARGMHPQSCRGGLVCCKRQPLLGHTLLQQLQLRKCCPPACHKAVLRSRDCCGATGMVW